MIELVLAVLTVLLGSGLASGTEAALFSVPVIKVRQRAQANNKTAQILLKIRENMNRPIATIVIINNIFNIVGSIVVGSIAAATLGDQWLGVFSGMLTFLVIIFSEIIPKTLGERFSEPIALFTARPVLALTYLFTPLVWLVEIVTSPITRGARRPTTNEAEIKLLANIGYQEGIIEDDEAEMIQRVFRLNDVTAGQLMTPRVAMTYLRGALTVSEAKDAVIGSQHTRIIVIDQSVDEVLGVARKGELLAALIEGNDKRTVADLAHEARFVPESVRADRLLDTFRETREHLAVVIDEYGGVAGVVTLEDVLEILTGEIVDETDRAVDLQELARRRMRLLQRRGQIPPQPAPQQSSEEGVS